MMYLFLNRHSSIKSTCVGLSISFFAPQVSNKLEIRRSLESGFDVTWSYLCSSSNLSIYKVLPRLFSKPLTCTAFRKNLYGGCSAFQPGTRGLFNQWWVWAASLALMWYLLLQASCWEPGPRLISFWPYRELGYKFLNYVKSAQQGGWATREGKSEQAQFHSSFAVQYCPEDCCSLDTLSPDYSTV